MNKILNNYFNIINQRRIFTDFVYIFYPIIVMFLFFYAARAYTYECDL